MTTSTSAHSPPGPVALVAAALVALNVAASPGGSQAVEPHDTGLHPCATATERCDGVIPVPLDWSDPALEEITIAFAWVPRGDTTRPAVGTILANPGGPTAALPMIPLLQQVLGPVLERQNLLVVDPRGFGQSDALLCPGLELDDLTSVAACAEHLGPRLTYYTADQAVADMDAVRRALGVPVVSFYGNSYGTLLAQAYATRFPASLSALFLDSVVYTRDDGYGLEPVRFRVQDLEMVCDRSPACRAIPGTASAILDRLVQQLRAEPDPEIPLQALRPLAQGGRAVASREAVAAAAAYLAGDTRPLRRLTEGLGSPAPASPADPEWAGYLAYMCGDMWLPYDRAAAVDERRQQLAAYYASERPLWPLEISEVVQPSIIYEPCLAWPNARESRPVPRDAVYPAVPIVAPAGDFDTATPAEVREVIQRFPQGTVLDVPFGTHALAWSPLPYGQCVRQVLRSFLADPRDPPSYPGIGDCDAESYRAVGSFPRAVADVPPAQSAGLPGPDLHLVAAAFATAADAVVRRSPYNRALPAGPEQPGLRGGSTRWDRETSTITLDAVRFVDDLVVSGTVRIVPDHTVAAELVATGRDGRARDLTLEWRAFVAEDETAVSGSLDGAAFTGRVPQH